jgi:hypothetical protein
MLRQEHKAYTRSFASGTKPEPCSQRNAPGKLRRRATQIEHDGAEATALQQQIGCSQSLIKRLPRPAGSAFPTT